jgi:hypothetical protein
LLLLPGRNFALARGHTAKNDRTERSLTKSQGFPAIRKVMANDTPNFCLQFLDGKNAKMLEDRHVRAADVDDAVREAAFGNWPAGTQLCRIIGMDGLEIASVGRFRRA